MKTSKYLLLLLASVLLCGCTTTTYEDKSSYLTTVAQRGVETNKLFEDQEETDSNLEVCQDAHIALNQDHPNDAFLETSNEWDNLVRETFVSACITGRY